MAKIRIAVMAGGWSNERDISLAGGEAVFKELDRKKYDVRMYDPRNDIKKIIEQKENIDLAFILLHGRYGEDGRFQALLDILGIPFVGSGVLSSAMAMNKMIAKKMYGIEGMKVPEGIIVEKGTRLSPRELRKGLGDMTVVKPLNEGSSLGMSMCRNEEELLAGIEKAFQYGNEIMIEAYIKGREITCCVLGNNRLETLPLIEIVPKNIARVFDYESKYTPGATDEICPAEIDRKTEERARLYAIKAHQALRCRVWSRTDMIIGEDGIYILETNTIPGMTKTSLFPLAARTAGMSFSELLDKLIALSLEKDSSTFHVEQ